MSESEIKDGKQKILPEFGSNQGMKPESYFSRYETSLSKKRTISRSGIPKIIFLTTLFSFQENSWQFCSTITFFQILFIVLFGLFVKYDDDFYKNIESEHDPIAKAQLIAAQVGAFYYGLK